MRQRRHQQMPVVVRIPVEHRQRSSFRVPRPGFRGRLRAGRHTGTGSSRRAGWSFVVTMYDSRHGAHNCSCVTGNSCSIGQKISAAVPRRQLRDVVSLRQQSHPPPEPVLSEGGRVIRDGGRRCSPPAPRRRLSSFVRPWPAASQRAIHSTAGIDQRQTLEALDQRHIIIGRSAEMQPLELHPQVSGQHFVGFARKRPEGSFQIGKRDLGERFLNARDVARPLREAQRHAKQPPPHAPKPMPLAGRVPPRVLCAQHSKLQPPGPAGFGDRGRIGGTSSPAAAVTISRNSSSRGPRIFWNRDWPIRSTSFRACSSRTVTFSSPFAKSRQAVRTILSVSGQSSLWPGVISGGGTRSAPSGTTSRSRALEVLLLRGDAPPAVGRDRRTTEPQADGDFLPAGMKGVRIDPAGERFGRFAEFRVDSAQSPFVEKHAGPIGLMRQAMPLRPGKNSHSLKQRLSRGNAVLRRSSSVPRSVRARRR